MMLTTVPLLQIGFVLGASDVPMFSQTAALLFIKMLFLIAGLLYVIFALIVTRQIQLMHRTLVTNFGPFIQLLGFAQLALSLALLLFFFTL